MGRGWSLVWSTQAGELQRSSKVGFGGQILEIRRLVLEEAKFGLEICGVWGGGVHVPAKGAR